mmetsp:Transcript_29609/g.62947  ORF Transcript_29609/g.62947 Transcript_29609/m.62947 type:complete len:1140 (-) Transcript_29609:283-3702(-)
MSLSSLLLGGLGLRGLVDQIQEAPEVHIRLAREGHLAGSAGRVPVVATTWNLEVLQARLGQLLVPHAPVSGHAAAWDAALVHVLRAHAGQLLEVGLNAHLLGRARDVDGHIFLHLGELELVEEEVVHELDWLVHGEAEHLVPKLVLDGLRARAGVADHWDAPVVRHLLHDILQIVSLGVGGRLVTPAVEHHAAAQRVDVLWNDHVVIGLLQDRDHLLVHWLLHVISPGRSHHASDTRGNVDHRIPHIHVLRRGDAVRGVQLLGALRHVLVPDGNEVSRGLVEEPRGRLQEAGSKDSVEKVHRVQERGHQGVDSLEVVGREHGQGVGRLAHLPLPQRLDQLSRVDLDWALLLAHAVRGARGVPHVVKGLDHLLEPLLLLHGPVALRLQSADLPVHGDPLPWRQGDVLGRAVTLAEPALDALVGDVVVRVSDRRLLERLHVNLWVLVKDDARVEDVVRVEDRLEAPHDVVRPRAPLHLDKRRHVPARAMLGLERSLVLVRHDVGHLVHHRIKSLDLRSRSETLREHQMQVALQRMTKGRRVVVAIPAEHVDEVLGHLAQVVDRAGDIFDQHRGAGRPGAAHDWNEALPGVPVHLVLVRHLGEGEVVHAHLDLLRGANVLLLAQQIHHRLDTLVQIGSVGARALDQERSRVGAAVLKPLDELKHLVVVLKLAEGRSVEELDGRGHVLLPEPGGRFAGHFDVWEEHEAARLVRVLLHRVEGDVGNKGEGALTADHQLLQDLHGIRGGRIHQRVDGVAGGALDRELLLDQSDELLVGLHLGRQLADLLQQRRVRLLKGLHTSGVGRVQHRAIDEDQPQVLDGVIRVLGHAAAHAARVVRNDAADHARLDARWIRANLVLILQLVDVLVPREKLVHLPTDQARLDCDLLAPVPDLVVPEVLPVVRELEEDAVRDRLPAQRRAGRAKGHWHSKLQRNGKNRANLVFVRDLHDVLRVQPVEGGVRAVREGADGVREDPVLWEDVLRGQAVDEGRVAPVLHAPAVDVLEDRGVVHLVFPRLQRQRAHEVLLQPPTRGVVPRILVEGVVDAPVLVLVGELSLSGGRVAALPRGAVERGRRELLRGRSRAGLAAGAAAGRARARPRAVVGLLQDLRGQLLLPRVRLRAPAKHRDGEPPRTSARNHLVPVS